MYSDRISDNNALIQHGYFEEPASAVANASATGQHLFGSRPERPDRYSMQFNPPIHLASASAARSASLYPPLDDGGPTTHQQQRHLTRPQHYAGNHPHPPAPGGPLPAAAAAAATQLASSSSASSAGRLGRRLGHTASRTFAIATHREPPPPVLYEYRLYENSFDDHHFTSPLALAADPYYSSRSGSRNHQQQQQQSYYNYAPTDGPDAANYLSPPQYRRTPLGQPASSAYISQSQYQPEQSQSQHQRQQQFYRSYNHYYQHNNNDDIGGAGGHQHQHHLFGGQQVAGNFGGRYPAQSYVGGGALGVGLGATVNTTAYDAYGYPVKMQCEEVIIEHSQLVSIENHNGRGNNIINNNNNINLNGGRPGAGRLGAVGLGSGGLLPSAYSTQIIAALAVSLGPLAAGLGKGYASPAIASLQEISRRTSNDTTTNFTVSDQQASWVASLSLLGALFGGMFGGLAMQYGRRRLLTIMSLPFSLSWILTVFSKSVETMFATAFLGGFCCSIVSMVTQVYISEIASPDIRGFLSAIQKMAGHLGIMISFSLGAYLNWRQLAMLVSVAPMMLFLTVIYIPETPSFLLLKGHEQEAYRALQWLRGPHSNVELELETIKANVRASRLSTGRFSSTITAQNFVSKASLDVLCANIKSVLRNARLVRPILITCGLMIFQRFTGANSFNFYAVTIFRRTFAGMNPHGGAVSVGFVQLLASMVSGLLIDIVGRIPLLIVSSVFMSLALAGFGSFAYYFEGANKVAAANFDMDAAASAAGANHDWIPLLCVLVFQIAFSLGISPISSLLVAELFPLEYRGIGSSIATSFSYFCAFLSVKTFVDFEEVLGLHGVFWLYAFISCLGLIFVVLFVPETKGKDLEEMDPKYVRTLTINR